VYQIDAAIIRKYVTDGDRYTLKTPQIRMTGCRAGAKAGPMRQWRGCRFVAERFHGADA